MERLNFKLVYFTIEQTRQVVRTEINACLSGTG